MDLTELFKIILSLSFMGSIVAVIIIVMKLLLKNKLNAKWHYYIWLLLIIRLVMPYAPESSLSIFNLVPSDLQKMEVSYNSYEDVTSLPIEHSNSINENFNDNNVDLQNESNESKNILVPQKNSFQFNYEVLSIVWLIGAVIMFLYILVLNAIFILKTNKHQKCKDEDIIRIFKDCKSKINIHTNTSVVYDKSIKTPSIFGLFRPKLLISPNIINKLSQDEKRYVFLHELTHLKRKDLLINWIIVLVQMLHWFNPIIWYSFYKMREDCEVACDAYVLSCLESTEHKKYGETIINLINTISKPYWIPITTGMVGNKSSIKRRIKMIAMFKKNAYKWSIAAVALIFLVGCVGLTNSTGNKVDANNNETKYEIGYKTMDMDKLLEYKDSYVGDNSAVGNIVEQLPGNIFDRIFSLETSSRPYGIEINYELNEDISIKKKNLKKLYGAVDAFYENYVFDEGSNLKLRQEDFNNYWNENAKKIFLNNATIFFMLIKNVDKVKFNVSTPEQLSFIITREELEKFYGRDLRQYAENIALWEKEIYEETLNSSERIEKFYMTHNAEIANVNDSKEDEKEGKDIKLYFADDNAEYLIPEIRRIKNPTSEIIIKELVKGPTNSNLYKTLPENLEVIGVEIKEKIAYVNLSKNIEESMKGRYGTSTGSGFFLYSIVNTLTLNDELGINKVKLLIEGEEKELLNPLDIGKPFGPNMDMLSENSDKDAKNIKLYFGGENAEYVEAEVRKMKNPTPKSVMEELIYGPTDSKLSRTLPEAAKVISVEVKDKIAYVNFSKEIDDRNYGSSAAATMLLDSVVNTLALCDEFEIDKVQILIEGEKKQALGPLDIWEPYSAILID